MRKFGEDFFVHGLLEASKNGGKNYYVGGYFSITGLTVTDNRLGVLKMG